MRIFASSIAAALLVAAASTAIAGASSTTRTRTLPTRATPSIAAGSLHLRVTRLSSSELRVSVALRARARRSTAVAFTAEPCLRNSSQGIRCATAGHQSRKQTVRPGAAVRVITFTTHATGIACVRIVATDEEPSRAFGLLAHQPVGALECAS